jgi:hypothetical protein
MGKNVPYIFDVGKFRPDDGIDNPKGVGKFDLNSECGNAAFLIRE